MTTRSERIPADLAWRMWMRERFAPEPDPDAHVKIRNVDVGGDDGGE